MSVVAGLRRAERVLIHAPDLALRLRKYLCDRRPLRCERDIPAGASDAPLAVQAAAWTFADAAADPRADYEMNQKRSLRTLMIRIDKDLRPVFGRQPLTRGHSGRARAPR